VHESGRQPAEAENSLCRFKRTLVPVLASSSRLRFLPPAASTVSRIFRRQL
jgi:hypothetical protein